MIKSKLKKELNHFLGKAMKATYAGSGSKLKKTQRPGFIELEYSEKPWYYRDSYAGFIRSAGQEVVWLDETPFWSMVYGGGMILEFTKNSEFTNETFDFLKKSMSQGEKSKIFQPRGPNILTNDNWKYECEWVGDILNFKGNEKISFKNQIIFTYQFNGGIIDWG